MFKSKPSRKIMSVVFGGMLGIVTLAAPAFAGATIDVIKQRNRLHCGVSTGVGGWSHVDDKGQWIGFDVDFCRAIAAAVFDDAGKVSYHPVAVNAAGSSLSIGEADVLAGVAQYSEGGNFSVFDFVPTYHDTIGVMVGSSLGISSATELDGAAYCKANDSITNQYIEDYFRYRNMSFGVSAMYISQTEQFAGLRSANCDFVAGPVGLLSSGKAVMGDPTSYMILADEIENVVLGLTLTEADPDLTDIVKGVVWAMIRAEELGVTSTNVDTQKSSSDPRIRRLLGQTGSIDSDLGLNKHWAYQIIKQVGNYGEVFDRNLAPLGLSRGRNALYKDGGLMIAPGL